MITAGIDIGAVSTETVIIKKKTIIAYDIMQTGANSKETARRSLRSTLVKAKLKKNQINRRERNSSREIF